jgi:7-cyano-7-deazaguanine tRNA-ribosyltransferase
LEALQALEKEGPFLERFESTSRTSAFMHTGPESRHRPIVRRYQERLLKRYSLPKSTALYVVPEAKKPYHEAYGDLVELMRDHGLHFSVDSYFGPVPMELDLMYPLAQSLSAPMTPHEREELVDLWSKFEEANRITFEQWSEDEKKGLVKEGAKRSLDIDMLRVEAVARMQFGPRAASALLDGAVTLKKSPNGRIRNVLVDGDHVLSMRAHDGLYTLKVIGARRVLKGVKAPALRVVADKDAAPFVKEGKNLFAKFVQDCDGDLRPGDEAIIVDPEGALLAVGRLVLNKEEIWSFTQGVAVKVREHVRDE